MWEDRAKKNGISLSKYIMEMAERRYETESSQLMGSQIAKDLWQLREDIRELREELKLKSVVLENMKRNYSGFAMNHLSTLNLKGLGNIART